MLARALSGWQQLAVVCGLLLAAAAAGGALFVWSGIYNVSAARDHFSVTTWLLEKVRDQSVATQSAFVKVPPLDDDAMIRLGGAHYEGVCVPCHARPGEDINTVVAQMLPSPPHLSEALSENAPEEIFWIVKHGLKYTGMPAFPTRERDDEIWAVTAFLSELAKGEPLQNYRAIAGLDRLPNPASGQPPSQGLGTDSATQCIRCHDDARTAPHGDLVPRLAGQTAAYLRRSLQEYATGDRPSGIMQPVADALAPADIERLVAYYAELPAASGFVEAAAGMEHGRGLAEAGAAERGIPACLSCHGASGSPQFPNLAGQSAAYLAGQLTLWRGGGRAVTTYGQIMSAIARRLTEDDVRSVAAYFASLPAQPARAARRATAVRQ